ncbi:MAG: HAMP domain-containing histidine kinase [Acidobacteria bacterium]|nr:HAMP domain-containing histidine kinase [Acidobacteriota bacterium]
MTGLRLRAFFLLRLTLIIATSYLALAQSDFSSAPAPLALLIAAGLLSNLLGPVLPRQLLESPKFMAAVILFDTIWITVALIASGRLRADFFYLYFFILFLAAMGENLTLIVLGTLAVSAAYFFIVYATGGLATLLTTGTLIRIPFLLSVATFYGYLVDRLRHERQRSQEEAVVISSLREKQSEIEEVNRRLENEIGVRRRAEEELKRVSEVKTAFVSTVSHELRTPLTSIKNALDLLRPALAELDEPQQRFAEMARRNVRRLAHIIDDLLDVSRIEAGQMSFSFAPVAVNSLLDTVVSSLEPEAKKSSLEVELRLAPDLPEAWADAQRIEQVVSNLLSNAIKFTPAAGRVTVTAELSGQDLEIAVSDTGIGLSEEDRARVFEPFYQAGDPLTDRVKGTGLGLAISRSMVAAHGSDLVVESRLEEGSRFSFLIPVVGPRGTEIVELEAACREYSAYPFYTLLVIEPVVPETAVRSEIERTQVFDRLGQKVASAMPRSSDRLHAQPACGRLLLVLLGTDRDGGVIVRERLERMLAADRELRPSPLIHGPASFPNDGRTGFQLVRAATMTKRQREVT